MNKRVKQKQKTFKNKKNQNYQINKKKIFRFQEIKTKYKIKIFNNKIYSELTF